MTQSEEQIVKEIYEKLSQVMHPSKDRGIVDLGLVDSVTVSGDQSAMVILKVKPEEGARLEGVRQEAERSLVGLGGVKKVNVILTAERQSSAPPAVKKGGAPDPHNMAKNPPLNVPARHIIVVASGKGGVGKSTVAASLAVSMSKNDQLKIGLLDADIYGPSQPILMGLKGKKPESDEQRNIIPLKAHGVKVMSIGFMVDAEKALVWRGPMVQTAFYQLLRDVVWGTKDDPLDYLIIDMPPGTGDVQLTLAQKVKVDGAIIVSTPQDIALADARKAVEMFQTTDVPVLGLIENMSTHICTNCGHEEHIFGHGGAKAEAEKMGVRFLGEIPLSADIRTAADEGSPKAMDDYITQKILDAL